MITNEPLELITTREVTPLIDKVREKLPMTVIADLEVKVSSPGFAIEDEEEEARVSGYMRQVATWNALVTSSWKPYKQFWDKIHEACCAAEKETAPAIGRIKTRCEAAMKIWLQRKDEARRERQRLLDQQAELDRKKQAAEAKRAALSGDMEKAESLMKSSETLRAPVIMAAPTKLEGTSIKPTWVPEADVLTLLKAVADGRLPLMHEVVVKGKTEVLPLFLVNEVALKYMANKMGEQLNWPGVTVKKEIGFSTRRM
jgi:hypothetical protein